MANTVVFRGGMVAVWLMLAPATAPGQRLQFSTPIDAGGSPPLSAADPALSTVPGNVYLPAPSAGTPSVGVPVVPGPPATFAPGAVPAVAPGSMPGWTPPAGSVYGPGPASGLMGAPGANFQGTIQAPGWDPYGPPGAPSQPLLPTDPFSQMASPFGVAEPMTRLRQEIHLDHHWLARTGSQPFGTNDSELYGTFAFPFLYNQQTPLLVTPGFAVHLWDGPVSTGPDPRFSADLPPRAYDAYLDAAWRPQPTPWLGGDLDFRIGAYSDFSQATTRIIRFPSHGLAVLSFSPSFQVKAGVYYLDRNHIKLLPAGGVVWTPNSDTRFEAVFPNPKLSKRLTTIGTADWWLYARGEYGGGAWTVKRIDGSHNSVDYNDIRVAVGVESERTSGLHGGFEVGLAFDREIFYRETPDANIHPSPTFFLGGSVGF